MMRGRRATPAPVRPTMFRQDPDLVAHLPRLRRLAVALCRDREAADDLVQDTVARALAKMELFKGGNAQAWLATVMVNLFRSDRRRFGRLPALVDLDSPDALSSAGQRTDERRPDIRRALASLPEEQRVAILLLALDGLSYREIAEAQGVPIGTVMSRIARARDNLKSALDGQAGKVKALKR